MGSVPATVFYALVRNPIMNVMFVFEDGSGNNVFEIPSLSWALFAGVIIGAVLIECLIPLKAILKALKTSIRDIIFDNRDTEYKFSRSTFVFGLVCLALAIVTFIFKKNLKQCVDWSKIDKKAYRKAMHSSTTDAKHIKALLKGALTDQIDDREIFMKGIDYSYYYEQVE